MDSELKRCSTCNNLKERKYFPRDRNSKDGRTYNCRDCRNEYYRNRPVVNRVIDGYKLCSKCQNPKPIKEFYKDICTYDKLSYHCKECKKKYKPIVKDIEKPDNSTKICSKCKRDLPYSEFHRLNTSNDGACYDCKKCRVLTRHGITFNEFENIGNSQEWKCAICHKEDYKLVIDHDHNNGKIRGLLCRMCNMSLGVFGDSIEGLKDAIRYLDKSNG